MCGLCIATKKTNALCERLCCAISGETRHMSASSEWARVQQADLQVCIHISCPVRADFIITCLTKGDVHMVAEMMLHSPIPVSSFQISYFDEACSTSL